MADIFREVEEDVRRERYAQLWKKYGDYAIAVAALIIIGVAGWQLWIRYEAQQRVKAAEAFTAALELTDPAQSEAAFAQLAQNSPSGYAALAKFQQANALLQDGKKDQALAIYNQIASGDDKLLGGAARLRAAWIMVDTASKSQLDTLLAPLTDAASPWRYMAREVMAVADYKTGNDKQALIEFQSLSKEADAAQGIRQRASAMAAYLKSGGDKDVGTVPKPAPPPVPEMSVTRAPPGTPASGAPAPQPTPANPPAPASSSAANTQQPVPTPRPKSASHK